MATVFFLVFALLQVGIWFAWYRGLLDPILRFTAQATGACSLAMGTAVSTVGNEVYLPGLTLRIDLDCTGLPIAAVYAALVVAYPLRLKTRVVGLVTGVAVILLANLGRLVAVALLAARLEGEAFRFVHDYLFLVGMVAVVIVLWAVYLAAARRHAAHT